MPTKTETEYYCTRCYRWAPWTNGLRKADGETHDEFWCQTCGAEMVLSSMKTRTR